MGDGMAGRGLEVGEVKIGCPYCGEGLRVLVDPQDAGQEYVEDCQVCCRPILFQVAGDGGSVEVRREDE